MKIIEDDISNCSYKKKIPMGFQLTVMPGGAI